MMRLQHGPSQHLRRLSRRYPFVRRISVATTILTLIWFYTIDWGERSVFENHVDACHWEEWEEWPREANPHHLVFIADPQLVDPHTYPGRPWPLSALTEQYTDLYMARNFRLINDIIDPDTVIFLGDLFDGGREWAPESPKKLTYSQKSRLVELGILPQEAAFDNSAGNDDADSRKFVPGENGRWSRWDNRQWQKDFKRFGKIFFEPEQLYPYQGREMFAVYDVNPDKTSVQNGADNATWQEFATTGGKQRHVITSLPGNHDLGFGPGVQISIRDRFQSHFGESNRVDVIGNHTFVSLDVLSLAAHSYFTDEGYESDTESTGYQHIWNESVEFLKNVQASAKKAVAEALELYYPKEGPVSRPRWRHEVTDTTELLVQPSENEETKQAPEANSNLPAVVLSHVPLHRPVETECGPLRERSKAIRIAMGYQYQNVLTQTLSKEIVSKVSEGAGDILAVFSGDDHDYCDMTHRYNVNAKLKHIKEITVKSFSWAMGVRRPGFLLVSLWNPVDAQGKSHGTASPTLQTHLCLLPDQLNIFVDYGLLLGFTLAILAIDTIYSSWRGTSDDEDTEEVPPSPLEQVRMSLPRFQLNSNIPTNIYAAKAISKTRPRGTSTSSSSHSRNGSTYQGVQRSFNARTREVTSPIGLQQPDGPLIDRAGYFPQVRWTDPGDDDSDEEARLGARLDWKEDSQAKWKWRRRTWIPELMRKLLEEFGIKLLLVGVPGGLYYAFLVRNG